MNNVNEQGLIQEIEEDLARKRMEALWKRYAPFVIGGVLLVILATASVTGWRNYKTKSEQTTTQGLVELSEKIFEKRDDKMAELAAFAKDNAGKSQAAFALFESAGIALEQDKKAEAVAIYDALAADATVDPIYRQLADLFAVQVQLDTGDAAALEARLAPLMKDSPWRFTATEFAGHLALRTGDKEKAKKIFTELKSMPDVTPLIAARASDVLQWLGEGK